MHKEWKTMAVAALPALPEEENYELLKRAKGGDAHAKDLYFAHNYRLLLFVAQKFVNSGHPLDDLIGLAQVGFVKAYNTFELARGVKFATYSSRCMENEILMFLRKGKKFTGTTSSLDDPLHINFDGDALTLSDVIAAGDPEADARKEHIAAAQEVLDAFFRGANPREAAILRMYYGESKSMAEIGEELRLSQSYISRTMARIKKKLHSIACAKGSATQTEGKVVKMATINKGHLKHIFETTALNNGQIANIVGCSGVMVGKHRQKYDNGKMLGVSADDAIQPRVEAFLRTLTSEEQRRLEDRFKQKPSPAITVVPPSEQASEVRVTHQSAEAPANPEAEEVHATLAKARAAHPPALEPSTEAVTTEDSMLIERAETPVKARRPAITLTLDRVDISAIESFVHVLGSQMQEGESYRFHVHLEQL
jgi:RNA polymerase sporulation-specific sigma factor